MKNITIKWLQKRGACKDGIVWFVNQTERDVFRVLNVLLKDHKINYANWVVSRLMTRKQRIKYAIFAAAPVLEIYEKEYPNNEGPRAAIEAAQKVLEKDSKTNRDAAYFAAINASYAASIATEAAATHAPSTYVAAYAAANAAYAAASAARAATIATEAAATGAASAATDAARAYAVYTYGDAAAIETKIILFGIKLLKEKNK
jgi:hypothetical protein